MLGFVYHQLRFERARSILTVLAIAAVIAEILILEGFLAGFYQQLRSAVLNRGGDLVVSQAGISNFIATRSILPQISRLQVEEVEGVKAAHPLTGISAIYEHDERRTPIILLVYDTFGGPKSIITGERKPGERGIIIDEAIAVKYGLTPGDPMEISDFEFTVSGVSGNSAAFLTPFAFITYDDLIDFYFESDVAADIATFPLLSFLLVETMPGVAPGAVAEHIEQRVKTADVHLPAELAKSDERLGREMLGPILGLLLAVSYVIGALVVAMFMFAAVGGRIRTFGVQKALGVSMRSLATAVTTEAVILTILAMPIGILLAQGIAGFISEIAPVYLILATEPAAIARTSAACLGFAVLGALVPIRTIVRIDPAIVFRS